MRDLTIRLENRPGALADLGAALGEAGVSIDGGGAFLCEGSGVAHFLFEDGEAARRVLEANEIDVVADREVVTLRLRQGEPGQLGSLTRRMADAGVNIEVLYSDHEHRLVLVTSDQEAAAEVAASWAEEGCGAHPPGREHGYRVAMTWEGNIGVGTRSHREYERTHVITVPGSRKPPIAGSSDPAFRGDSDRWNPEELLLAALSACHQLAYLHLCAVRGVVVTDYRDEPEGWMRETADGGGRFERAVLHPVVTITPASDRELALALHGEAHRMCFIASSVDFPVDHEALIWRPGGGSDGHR
jgi:organic hydroperoxide reductase OsmC/OhrA